MSRQETMLLEEKRELTSEELRREIALYKRMFDSARLVVGHEFTKPLTAATGYLELLEDRIAGSLGEKEKGYLAKIGKALERLSELVETFVEMMRIENRDRDLYAKERFDVHALLEQMKGRFSDERDRLKIEIFGNLRAVVGNRRCIEIVLDNLVSNSLEHADGSLVLVKASLIEDGRNQEKKQAFLVLIVKDNGAGIPRDKLQDVFTPFFRLNSGVSGLGLGLSLVRSILTVITGEISIESEEGKGTTVTVRIPVSLDGAELPEIVG